MKFFEKLRKKLLRKAKKFDGYDILPDRGIQKNLLGGAKLPPANQNRVKQGLIGNVFEEAQEY